MEVFQGECTRGHDDSWIFTFRRMKDLSSSTRISYEISKVYRFFGKNGVTGMEVFQERNIFARGWEQRQTDKCKNEL